MLKRINKLLANRWFPLTFRIVTFIAFLGLVIIGFSAYTSDEAFLRRLSRTNLTSSFVWRLWWPLIILSAIIFGRVWCMVCPVEMITTFFAKIGFKRKRPQWILSGWGITLFYTIIVILGVTILEIDRNPKYTTLYLLTILGVSVLVGLIFEKNTFCRYICPVGYVLGIFSKMAIWGWRVKSKSVCDSCSDKSCINDKYVYQLNYKSCGVDLIPAEISSNNNCLLCAGCLKTCNTYRTRNNSLRPNPAIRRIGFANNLMQIKSFNIAEWFFLFFLSGHLIDEITEFRLISNACSLVFQKNISDYLSIHAGFGEDLIAAAYLFFILPVILWILPYTLILFGRMRISLGIYLKYFSQIFLPIIIALFVGLIIFEVATKVPYYKYIVHDVRGIETIQAILNGQIVVTRLPRWSQWVFSSILILTTIISIVISFKVIRQLIPKLKIQKNKKLVYILPFIFLILFFMDVLLFRCF